MLSLSDTHRGMACMLLSTLTFAAMNAVVRQLSGELHPFEVYFFRSLFGVVVFLPLIWREGVEPLRTQRLGLHVLRGTVTGVSMLLFFLALKYAPLAKVSALFFLTPLFGALLAMLILGERVHLRRIAALAAGFAGMLVIVQPGAGGFDLGSGLVLASAVLAGLAILLIKRLSTTESSVSVTIYTGLASTPLALVVALPYWQMPNLEQLAWMALIGGLGSIAQVSMVRGLALADATAVLPLDFTKLIWAAVLGYLMFAEVPEVATWIGGTIIFAAAIYVVLSERRQAASAT